MKINARNLLAEAILDALDNPEAAVALCCIAAYCNTTAVPPKAIIAEALFSALPSRQQIGVEAALRKSPLLSWETRTGEEIVTLSPALTEDCGSTVSRLLTYAAVLGVWTPDKNDDQRTTALRKGALLFNHHLFFEVHEILEEQWKQENGEIRTFLQGLIQIAVAFHHLRNDNFRGATALLHDGLAKVIPHQPTFLGIELVNFVARLEACQQELRRRGPEHLHGFPAALIPPIEFVRESC
jgi:uncharacterized protein